MSRYEAFDLNLLLVNSFDGQMVAQGTTVDGKKREFGIQVVRDLATNQLSLVPYRHYTDPDSTPTFSDSEPWTEDERRGDTE